jgi:hypothetical protein
MTEHLGDSAARQAAEVGAEADDAHRLHQGRTDELLLEAGGQRG